MTERILLDTGPLVAILRRKDAHHSLCVQFTRNTEAKLITSWPVITEASWILRAYVPGMKRLLKWVDDGTFEVLDLERGSGTWMAGFIEKYKNIRAQLADAALMYLAEQEDIDTIFTLDRRDFSVYRTSAGKALRIVPEA